MNKRKSLTIIFLLFTSISFSQYGRFEPDGYIGISGGISSPSADLEMKAFDRINSAYATQGLNLNLSFAYKLYDKKYGIAALASYSSLPIDINAFKNDMDLVDTLVGASLTTSQSDVMIASVLAGAYAQFRLARKTYFNLRLMVGPSYFTFPTYDANLSSGNHIMVKEGYNKTAFSYDFGLSLKYMITSSLYLLGDVDFFSSTYEVNNLYTLTTQGKVLYDNLSPRIRTTNASFGIGFFLDKY